MTDDQLPPLPEPSAGTMLRPGREREKVYTEAQMRAYAQEAVRQEREAINTDAARYRYVRAQFLHSADRYEGEDCVKWVMWTDGKVVDPDDGSASFDAAVDDAIRSRSPGESAQEASNG